MEISSRQFKADLGNLADALAFVGAACAAAGLEPGTVLRAELVVEELFSNSARHGYAPGTGVDARPVWITVERGPAGVVLVYQDAAAPFNPLIDDPDWAVRAMARRQIGGLGRGLVSELADRADYAWQDGRNTLRFHFRRNSSLAAS